MVVIGTAWIHSALVQRTVVQSKRELLSVKLSLLENRVNSAYDVLFKVGLGEDPFFLQNSRENIVRYFMSVLGPGEEFFIFSREENSLSGSVEKAGVDVVADDPLLLAFSSGSGIRRLRSDYFLSSDDSYIVAFSHFDPLGWDIAVAANERLLNRSIGTAISVSLLVSLSFVIIAAFGFMIIARRVSRPLSQLADLTRELAEGRYEAIGKISATIPVGSGDEIHTLAKEFESMAFRIGSLTRGLEARVMERTKELEHSNRRLEVVNADLSSTIDELRATQDHLVAAEKMAALGQLVAGIAHELNTPLGAISSAGRDVAETIERHFFDIMDLYRSLPAREKDAFRSLVTAAIGAPVIVDTMDERKERWRLQSILEGKGIPAAEELAGRIVDLMRGGDTAGLLDVAVNPGGGELVLGAWRLAMMNRSLRVIELAADKASKVVMSLKIYSRQDSGEEPVDVDLRAEIDTILTLFQNALKHDVEIIRDYGAVPMVCCRRDRLSQVWINLIDNAAQAMDYSGTLRIAVRTEGDTIVVSVIDSGPGITEYAAGRIFTPFFTTKPQGEGSGLGLSICKRIVEESGGSIRFESAPGRTAFIVTLPLVPH